MKRAGPPGLAIPSLWASYYATIGGSGARWNLMRTRWWASSPDLMFSHTCTYKVIRVPTGVETGTDVPARSNGLISCRHIPPGDPLLLRNIILCNNGGGRAQSRRMTCELSTHNKSKTLVLSRHPARRKDASSALFRSPKHKCLCSALGTDAFAQARLLTPTYKCEGKKNTDWTGGVGGHRSDVFEFVLAVRLILVHAHM